MHARGSPFGLTSLRNCLGDIHTDKTIHSCLACMFSVPGLSFRFVTPTCEPCTLTTSGDVSLLGVATVLFLNPIYNQSPGGGLGSETSIISKKMFGVNAV